MLNFIDLTHAFDKKSQRLSRTKKNIKHMDNKLFIIVMHEYNFFYVIVNCFIIYKRKR